MQKSETMLKKSYSFKSLLKYKNWILQGALHAFLCFGASALATYTKGEVNIFGKKIS